MQSKSSSSGFTLIELTIVLAVIVTLALLLTPSITTFVQDTRIARARSDVQTISSAITQFYRDTSFFPLTSDSVNGGLGIVRVDMLVSPGATPLLDTVTPLGDVSKWTIGTVYGLRDELANNTPQFKLKTAGAQFGWNGPYMSSEIDEDPWSNRYMVNVGLIDTREGAMTSTGAIKSAVYVISAGPNGLIETPYTQPIASTLALPGATVAGDDIGTRVQ